MVRRRKNTWVTLCPVVLSVMSFAGLGGYVLFIKRGNLEGFRLFGDRDQDAVDRQKQALRTADVLSRAEDKIAAETAATAAAGGTGTVAAVAVIAAVHPVHRLNAPDLGNIKIEYPDLLTEPPTAKAASSYPRFQSVLDIVSGWNPDVPDPPEVFRETLMHFNYSNPVERGYAEKFREAELPFKLYDVPEFTAASQLWDDTYLENQFHGDIHGKHVEKSKNNHFMYWTGHRRSYGNGDWKPPTEFIDTMKFDAWLAIAKHADEEKVRNETVHYYFMSNAQAGDTQRTFIARDLPLFSTRTNNFFVTDVPANKGIQCRFGMRGIIAEAHYDTGRNMVAMLKGAKRYILNPPSMCKKLGIITDTKHPSYRHSLIDWSDINQAKSFDFANVNGIDTIVRTGEVLYIPSFWFHYIVSLKYSIQCNTRSGTPPNEEGKVEIEQCLGISLGDMFKYNGGSRKNSKLRKGAA